MTQGDLLAIIAYGIGILPLINNIKRELPDVTQPWYADNAGSLGTFDRLDNHFYSLSRPISGRGYHPKPTKIIIIVRPENYEAGKFSDHVTDLGCARAHVILEVSLGNTSPNTIG